MTITFALPELNIIFSLSLLLKLSLAVLIGTIIGRERKRNSKPGGARTFTLICLGSTLISLLSIELYKNYSFDFVRLMAYGLASIGFIGSGIIIQNKNKVEGLTTASTLWIIMLIGFLIGLGYFILAIFSSIFIYFILECKTKKRIKDKKAKKEIDTYEC